MVAISNLRQQVEATLAHRIPSALTPQLRAMRPVAATGIQSVDQLLGDGLPLGAITEVVGSECSGRASFALSFLAGITQAKKVCAWIDVSDELDPESAAAAGVELSRFLWVRCGVNAGPHVKFPQQPGFSLSEKYFVPPPIKKGLHGGGFGPHPRNETKDLSDAVSQLLRSETPHSNQAYSQHRKSTVRTDFEQALPFSATRPRGSAISYSKPWSRIGQALRVADLLLQKKL
jgi:recombination protein RecA